MVKLWNEETFDTETGAELAHYGIVFENTDGQDSGTAYIPLDSKAKDRLHALGLPTISPDVFSPNEEISIPMEMFDAINYGILDAGTVESIEHFPTVCPNPEWTHWHQLDRFFEHYTRDADAPMHWDDSHLMFWLPPMLHPKIRRLLYNIPLLYRTAVS